MPITQAHWYFDFISPFAYLQWRRLHAMPHGLDITPVPIVFAKLLDHHGQKGPAEIPGKRIFTYQFALWRARQMGLQLRCPPAHPFNPLPALRLAIALDARVEIIDAIFTQLWERGAAVDSAETLGAIAQRFGLDVDQALADAAVKARLRSNTEQAIAAGVYGVPTLAFGERLFWGEDATAMALAYASDPAGFDDDQMLRAAQIPMAVQRGS